MDELQAAIGRVQLRKLPSIISRRSEVVELLREKLAGSKTIIFPELMPGAKHSYWWLRLKINLDALPERDKFKFLDAVIAEGVTLMSDYSFMIPSTFDWYINRRAFGSSHHPWSAKEYKGDAGRQFPIPNTRQVMAEHFNLFIYESWGEAEVNAITEAFFKVENCICG
jgi:dTDP-4-amino-4,6-dideoxygalactose transaminase